MQDAPFPPHLSLRQAWPWLLLGLITGTPAYIKIYLDSKKSAKEVNVSDALAEKTRAEARSLGVKDQLDVGGMMLRMMNELADVQSANQQLRNRIFELEQAEIALKITRHYNVRLKGLLDAHGIPFSEAETPQDMV